MDGKAEPALRIVWYATPEEVDAAMWAPSLAAEGLTQEDLAGATYGAETEDGETVVVSQDDVMQGMRAQGCWGWVDTSTRTIHAWAAPDAEPSMVMHMLAHEIGHITGEPLVDDMAEEARAETFGAVAAQAFRLFAARPPVTPAQRVEPAIEQDCSNCKHGNGGDRLTVLFCDRCTKWEEGPGLEGWESKATGEGA